MDTARQSSSGISSIQRGVSVKFHEAETCNRKKSSIIQGPLAGHISPHVTLGALPDDVLLDIFEFCRPQVEMSQGNWASTWYKLVHVCQRWRYVIFASPLRLNLHLLCTASTPVRETLDVWPPLPIEVSADLVSFGDNIFAALNHPGRVRRINLDRISLPLNLLATVMQEPFPALESLSLWADGETSDSALPNTFLGGSAPRLQSLILHHVPFPTLPRLLLSSNDIVDLHLSRIPHTGYISPEAIVTCISALTKLMALSIGFESPASRPNPSTRCPPPLTRVIVPALVNFDFHGMGEYLEDLVARIDAPRLSVVKITFFNQLVFDIRQLQLFCRAPVLTSCNQAEMHFNSSYVEIKFRPPTQRSPSPSGFLDLKISCRAVDWQVSSMAQICSWLSLLLCSIEQLDIRDSISPSESTWKVDMDDTQWLEFFLPFTAVKTLRMSRNLGSLIVSALQGLGEELTKGVLPTLGDLYLEGYQPSETVLEGIEPFLTARQCVNRPVVLHCCE